MKKYVTIYFLFFILGLSISNAQSTGLNADFSLGNFTGWTGSTGTNNSAGDYSNVVAGIVAGTPNSLPSGTGQQTIMNIAGTDPNTGGALSVIPPSGTSSCRLGNDKVSKSVGGNPQAARLEYKLHVTNSNCVFTYKYAVVLQNSAHTAVNQPKFTMYIMDSTGNIVDPVCGIYEVTAGSGISGYQTCLPASTVYSPSTNVVWKDWTFIGIDLSAYIGQNITIQFTSYDCSYGDHFGYAYISCSCGSLHLSQQCSAGSAVLTAPAGFAAYQWSPGNQTTQSITINNPVNGTVYTYPCTNLYGCSVTLKDTIHVNPVFSTNSPKICAGETTNLTASGSGYTYNWSNGLGTNSTVSVSPSTTTTYTVTATSAGGCSSSSQAVANVVPLPVPNLFGPASACTGATANVYRTDTGKTGYYSWSVSPGGTITGGGIATSDSAKVVWNSAGAQWVSVNYANDSCYAISPTVYPVTVETIPTAAGTINGITTVCQGDNNIIYSIPAIPNASSYLWTLPPGATGSSTANSISVNFSAIATSGNIQVEGQNSCGIGAQSTIYINVNNNTSVANFVLSADSMVPHHYYALNNASGIPPLTYLWSWGDGTFDNIAYPSHSYSAAGNYTICHSITDASGCTNTFCDTSYLQKDPNTMVYVDVVSEIVTGINGTELSDQIKIYPNPANNKIEIVVPEKSEIKIMNLEGQILKNIIATDNSTTIDISGFAKGMYFVKVKTEKGVIIKKFVKE